MKSINQILLLSTVIAVSTAFADWPQWRGPSRDGVWHEDGLVTSFDADALELRWSAPIGAGYSAPTVAGGRVYVADFAAGRVLRLVAPES